MVGGRGHDFSLYDEEADAAGGMLVIASNIPASERDWIQWKGRTARSDRKGQYAVILCKDDEPISKADAKLLESFHSSGAVYGEGLIRALLDLRDVDTGKKIASREAEIGGGKRGNELCDKYYQKHVRAEDAPWYCQPHDKALSAFINKSTTSFSKSAVQEFADGIGLRYSSAYK